MTRAHLSLTTLALCATVPFAWLACGGSKPPPETPADESASNADGGKPSDDTASSAAPASSSDTSSPPPADTSAAATPPPAAPPFGGSDCGLCIDKTCKAQAAACGKNSDCQSMLDGFHGCGSDKGAAACLDAANVPASGKPKKLGTAYATCAKKAIAKACKTKCQ